MPPSATAPRPSRGRRHRRVLAAGVVLACAALAAGGCAVDPTGSAADDSLDELVERLEAADGVTEVGADPAEPESDSGEPGTGASLDVEMSDDATRGQVALVLARIAEQGSVTDAAVALGDTATSRTLADGGSPELSVVDEGADTEAGARVLVAATSLVRDRFGGRAAVAVTLADTSDRISGAPTRAVQPRLTLRVATRDDDVVDDVARAVAGDPDLADVDVQLYATVPRSAADLGFGPKAGAPSLVSGPGGLTPEVLDTWDRVRAAADLVDDRVEARPEYVHHLPSGASLLGADLDLPGSPRSREATHARYGPLVEPMVRAHLELLAGCPSGSSYDLVMDGDVLLDVTTGTGADRSDSDGRPDWNRAARRYLDRDDGAVDRRPETRSSGCRAGS